MNLVAKEYCACRIDEDGVLILSQFAGAAEQLKPGAVLVNPYDVEQMAETILQAFCMSQAERSTRVVRNGNIFRWVDFFPKAAANIAAQSAQFLGRRSARIAH